MTPSPDLAIYGVQTAVLVMLAVTRAIASRRFRTPAPPSAPVAAEVKSARFSRLMVAFHGVAFAVMYFGIGNAVIPDRVPSLFPGQRIVGSAIILGGGAIMAWALVAFRSWRFRAAVEQGHELATGGPFAFVRNPIYLGMNLFAVGSAVWIPTIALWVGAALMIIGGDLRARAEEKLLAEAFGAAYEAYRARTWRFIPGVY